MPRPKGSKNLAPAKELIALRLPKHQVEWLKQNGLTRRIETLVEENMNYVYGWYNYRDGGTTEFRYPAKKDADLRENDKTVTVEIKINGEWTKRRGVVSWGGGNYTVFPA